MFRKYFISFSYALKVKRGRRAIFKPIIVSIYDMDNFEVK